jgi:hypothetical protein
VRPLRRVGAIDGGGGGEAADFFLPFMPLRDLDGEAGEVSSSSSPRGRFLADGSGIFGLAGVTLAGEFGSTPTSVLMVLSSDSEALPEKSRMLWAMVSVFEGLFELGREVDIGSGMERVGSCKGSGVLASGRREGGLLI